MGTLLPARDPPYASPPALACPSTPLFLPQCPANIFSIRPTLVRSPSWESLLPSLMAAVFSSLNDNSSLGSVLFSS